MAIRPAPGAVPALQAIIAFFTAQKLVIAIAGNQRVIACATKDPLAPGVTIGTSTAIATDDQVVIGAAIQRLISAIASTQRVSPGSTNQGLISAVPALQAIVTANNQAGEVVAKQASNVAPARDQRVIAGIAIEILISAALALQAIGIGAAKERLTEAPARDQRVIPGIAIELLTN